jgi:S-adenosylmethionine decarboxylase
MAETYPQITVRTGAEAQDARAEVGSVQAREDRAEQQRAQLDLVHSQVQTEQKDYWINRDGLTFAGVHLIVDMWDADRLDDEALIQQALKDAAIEAGATLLHVHTHKFEEGGGVSGVAVLAESHISVHTWPERRFAAFDIFMCGCARPVDAIPALRRAFTPGQLHVVEHKRGIAL